MIRIKISHTSLMQGSKIPKGYGLGKVEIEQDIRHYYIIPINFIVRFWERTISIYYSIMFPQKLFHLFSALYSKGWKDGFKRGIERGRIEILVKFEDRINEISERIIKWTM